MLPLVILSILLMNQLVYGKSANAASGLGVETFAFDPASNLLNEKTQQVRSPLEQNPNPIRFQGQ